MWLGAVAVFRHTIFGVSGFMRSGHDAIFQRQLLQLIGL